MNEKLKYAEMLEIPLSTCNLTFKPTKKRKRKIKNDDSVKERVISKVNEENVEVENLNEMEAPIEFSTSTVNNKSEKKPFKLSVVKVELCVIVLLLATIFLTSIFIPTSGINTFFNKSLKKETQTVDLRTFEDFAPVFGFSKDDAISTDGVLTIKKQGSIYAPCDGKVSSVIKDDSGLYTIEVSHSENFKSVITGLQYAYSNVGDTVYKTIPIGYVKDGEISVFFKDGENQIVTDNVIATCSVVWD
ncbi:MAG: hypothetical protein KBS91_00960 [Firmicutes bacterium]|nr:hypothetical protein [Candidatus Caballimonas caccae]